MCEGLGIGSIQTTVYRNGVAEKIPNLDSTSNPACTNFGDGTASSGAAGYWVLDGETSPGNPTDTAQGNCMTCHDVHWAIADTNPEAEPFRRECPTCHVNPASASGAPQIDLAVINHLKTPGTPLENWTTDPASACETCHMPKSGGPNSSFMHLWRINTDAGYTTMGATEANLAFDAYGYSAAWVDVPHACGQCHGTDGVTAPNPLAPPRTTEQLAQVAKGMHSSSGVSYQVTFSVVTNGLAVTTTPIVDCGGTCPTLTYDWDWGDGTHAFTNPGIHTYLSGGTKSVTLTVFLNGGTAGSSTRSFTITAPGNGPVSFGLPDPINATCQGAGNPYDCCTDVGTGDCATCTFDPNTWKMSLSASASGGTPPLQFVVRWGDSSTASIVQNLPSPTGPLNATHTYLSTGGAPYTVTETVIDAKLNKDVRECAVQATPARFKITGTVVDATNGGTPVQNALVKLKRGTTVIRSVYTAADGTFTLKNLAPGSYKLRVSKNGFTFPAAQLVSVGPDLAVGTISGTQP